MDCKGENTMNDFRWQAKDHERHWRRDAQGNFLVLPEGAGRVKELRFNTKDVQVVRDDFRGAERVCRRRGVCQGCGRSCYGFDDGENDPRGLLTEAHCVDVLRAKEHDAMGEDVMACFKCRNDGSMYARLMKQAWKQWTPYPTMETLESLGECFEQEPGLRMFRYMGRVWECTWRAPHGSIEGKWLVRVV